jgi:CRISPR-associated exonuclease Cas4
LSFVYDEEDLIPISALQHLMFCERQWALIHLEQIWEENRLTVEGRHLHEKVDTPQTTSAGNIKIARGLRLRSLRLGLTGVTDVVEFHPNDKSGVRHPYPIEYKRGKPKRNLVDSVQLCAQALCLEEMIQIKVPKAAFFYGETKRRFEIEIDESLRKETFRLIRRLHQVANAKKTPPAVYEKKCTSCSLYNWCMPTCTNGSKNINYYLDNIIKMVTEDCEKS